MSTILIDRLSELVTSGEISRSGLARAAGLHPNSLRKLGDMDWNLTADTLVKLEKFLASGSRGVMASPEKIIDEARNRSEEHTSELQSLMRISYAVFCLKKKKKRSAN